MAKTDLRDNEKKIKDQLAKLNSIQVRAQEAADSLGNNLVQNEALTIENQRLLRENSDMISSTQKMRVVLDNELAGFKGRDQSLQSREAELRTRELDFQDKLKVEQDIAATRLSQIQNDIIDIAKQKTNIESELSRVEGQLIQEIFLSTNELAEVQKQLDIEQSSYKQLLRDHSRVLRELESSISTKRSELLDIQQQVIIEKQKIAGPMTTLREFEKTLEKKKVDLDIYRSRIHTRFRKVFPNQIMNA